MQSAQALLRGVAGQSVQERRDTGVSAENLAQLLNNRNGDINSRIDALDQGMASLRENSPLTGEFGGDFDMGTYLKATRAAESSGNDSAKNPLSTATGRYQFIESTWNGLMKNYPQLGLTSEGRLDPAQQERAMRQFTNDNLISLRNAGIPVNNGSAYAAHFLGPRGAINVLRRNDDEILDNILGNGVMEANPFLRGWTVNRFKGWAASKGGAV